MAGMPGDSRRQGIRHDNPGALPIGGSPGACLMTETPDAQATAGLQHLHAELLRHNPHWLEPAGRGALNHFMAALVGSFFSQRLNLPAAASTGFPACAGAPQARAQFICVDGARRLPFRARHRPKLPKPPNWTGHASAQRFSAP